MIMDYFISFHNTLHSAIYCNSPLSSISFFHAILLTSVSERLMTQGNPSPTNGTLLSANAFLNNNLNYFGSTCIPANLCEFKRVVFRKGSHKLQSYQILNS